MTTDDPLPVDSTPAAPVLITPLSDICIDVVAANFEKRPQLGDLPTKYVARILDKLSLDLPLELAGTLISEEPYWKRRSCARWRNCLVDAHGKSWKQLYFERNLEEALERFNVATSDVTDLKRLMTYSKRYVQNLKIRQLPSHLDLEIILESMVNSPSSLTLCYGMQDVGMEYERALFGMKLCDCRSLARFLERTETLTYLDLSSNMLDDDKARMIASGMVDNLSVTHLDLSHNKIADRGMRALAKVLDEKCVLAALDLYDNHIHSEGGRALARALKNHHSIQSLNLRLNRLGDEGCRSICDALRGNTVLTRLNLSANGAGPLAAEAISGLLRKNVTLRELDLSCNDIGDAGGAAIRRALEENLTLTHLDLRMSAVSEEEESAMIEILQQRAERKERQKIFKG